MDVTALIASLIMMSYVGRKPLLTIGHSLMALLTMLIGLLFYFNSMMGVLITTISYLFVFLSMTGLKKIILYDVYYVDSNNKLCTQNCYPLVLDTFILD